MVYGRPHFIPTLLWENTSSHNCSDDVFEDEGSKRLAKAASTRPEAAAYLDVVCVHYSIYTVL